MHTCALSLSLSLSHSLSYTHTHTHTHTPSESKADSKEASAMSSRGGGGDQHLRELLMEKTGEVHKLKAEVDKYVCGRYMQKQALGIARCWVDYRKLTL